MMHAKAILNLIEELAVLKYVPRSGWAIRGIQGAESIADHAYRMATLAMVLADVLVEQGVDLDADKVTRMALLHEIGEARIGDIPYPAMRHIDPALKRDAEQDAIEAMLDGLGVIGERYRALWIEFETGDTLEAKLVRAADKLEMLIQVAQYEKIGFQSLDEFWTNPFNQKDFDVHQLVQDVMTLLVERRNARRNRP